MTHAPPGPVTIFGPDFPFAYDDWLRHPAGLASIPEAPHGATVAVVGAGVSGMVAAYELMELGLRPVVYESARIGGRLRSHQFEGADGVVAELGGMRFPVSGTSFFHYADRLGLESAPFPNPLTEAAGTTFIDIAGRTFSGDTLDELPLELSEVASAWDQALEEIGFSALQNAIRARDVDTLKRLWDELVPLWDGRTFYDFIATSQPFSELPFFQPAPRSPACTEASRGPASPPSTGTPTALTSPCATVGAPAGLTRRSLPPARAGSSRPRSTATRASSRTSCGWRSTGPATCRRPRRS